MIELIAIGVPLVLICLGLVVGIVAGHKLDKWRRR